MKNINLAVPWLMSFLFTLSFLGCQSNRSWDNPLEPYRNQPPSPPSLLTPPNGAINLNLSPQLVWSSSRFAQTYSLQLSHSSDFSHIVFQADAIAETTCLASGLDTNRIYYWRVRASNLYGSSDWSAGANFRTATVSYLLAQGLVACYRFNGNIQDSLGSYHGTGNGFLYTTDRFGYANRAVYFDGSNDYIRVPRMVADDFTIAFWFRSDQGVGSRSQWWSGAGLVDAEVSSVTNDFGTSLNAEGRVLAGTGNPDVTVSSTSGHNNNQWHFVAFA